jgi:UbiD family decarboxylase
MEDFYIGGASVKLFLPVFKMNFPEIVDLALPAEGVFHNLVFVSIRKTYPMQAYKIMHGLWDMGQMMFTKYLVVVDDDVDVHNKPLKEVVNLALHIGLDTVLVPPAAKPYRTKPRPLGLREGFSYDSIADLLARAEGEDHR